MSNPNDSEGELLKLADQIGLNPAATPVEDNKDWTPDQVPPAMAKAMADKDNVPDFEAFAMTFGGPAAGGKGIVMNGGATNMTPNDEIGTKKAERGFHKDGSPRDAMESLDDCLHGFCAICK